MRAVSTYIYVKTRYFLSDNATSLLVIAGFVLLVAGLHQGAYADSASSCQDGDFGECACDILHDLMDKNFGAMLTVITGALAIVLSILGVYKGAWAVLFVSVGCFISEQLIKGFFPGVGCLTDGN